MLDILTSNDVLLPTEFDQHWWMNRSQGPTYTPRYREPVIRITKQRQRGAGSRKRGFGVSGTRRDFLMAERIHANTPTSMPQASQASQAASTMPPPSSNRPLRGPGSRGGRGAYRARGNRGVNSRAGPVISASQTSLFDQASDSETITIDEAPARLPAPYPEVSRDPRNVPTDQWYYDLATQAIIDSSTEQSDHVRAWKPGRNYMRAGIRPDY